MEAILNQTLYSIKETLTKQLSHSLSKCLPLSEPVVSSLKYLPSLWNSHLSPQIIYLVTHLLIYQSIREGLDKYPQDGGRVRGQLQDELQQLITTASGMIVGQIPVPPGDNDVAFSLPEAPVHTMDDGTAATTDKDTPIAPPTKIVCTI